MSSLIHVRFWTVSIYVSLMSSPFFQSASNLSNANLTSAASFSSTLNSQLFISPASEKLLDPVITLPNISGTLTGSFRIIYTLAWMGASVYKRISSLPDFSQSMKILTPFSTSEVVAEFSNSVSILCSYISLPSFRVKVI